MKGEELLKQKELIANVKNLTESDERITACMMDDPCKEKVTNTLI